MLRICGPKDKPNNSDFIINCCSSSKNWSKGLSPFICGPCTLPDGSIAQNVENAWQFSKVYEKYGNIQLVDEDQNPNEEYFKWRKIGFEDKRAHRYPMGKGSKPLYSWSNGKKLTYIEARKELYVPIYAEAVSKSSAFRRLQSLYDLFVEEHDIWLWDYDGYDHKSLGLTYQEAMDSPMRKFGHAFVVGMLLEGEITL